MRIRIAIAIVTLAAVVAVSAPLQVAQAQVGDRPFGGVDSIRVVAPGKIRATGWAIDPLTSAPVAIEVRVRAEGAPDYSAPAASSVVTANRPRTDIGAAFPQFGPNRGFDTTLTVPGGTWRVCSFVRAGLRTVLLDCAVFVSTPGGNPIGGLDVVRARTDGKATIVGWAIDPDTADPIDVHIYANGRFLQVAKANVNRTDVARIYPAYGSGHGFRIEPLLGVGSHQICAYAINVATGWANSLLGCQSIRILDNPDLRGTPFGSLDNARAVTPRSVLVSGWAIDRDTASPVGIEIRVGGRLVTTVSTGITRADVARTYPGVASNGGYRVEVPVGPGAQQVCARALNVGRGFGNTELGCRNVVMPTGNPFGFVEDVTSISLSEMRVRGWAIDPDVVDPVAIHVYINGQFVGSNVADRRRGDVGRAHPLYGDAHGFDFTVPYSLGRSEVCVFAINAGPGTTNPRLGCRTITVTLL
jgi:hypothetical protein